MKWQLKLQETLYILMVLWLWPVQHCLDLNGIHSDVTRKNYVSQELGGLSIKLALLHLNGKLILQKSLQNLGGVFDRGCSCIMSWHWIRKARQAPGSPSFFFRGEACVPGSGSIMVRKYCDDTLKDRDADQDVVMKNVYYNYQAE